MKPRAGRGFFVERAALFFYGLSGYFVLKGRSEIKRHFSKAVPVRIAAFLLKGRLFFVWPLGNSLLSGRAETKAHFSKAAAALLHAYNEAWCGS
jgi:hypothetical protein